MIRELALIAATVAPSPSPSPSASTAASSGLPPSVISALATVTSFQFDSNSPTGATIHATLVLPNRAEMRMTAFPLVETTVVVGDLAYVRIGDGSWTKVQFKPGTSKALGVSMLAGVEHGDATVLPDRSEDGITLGAFSSVTRGTDPSNASGTATTTCTYDKTTSFLRTCSTKIGDASAAIEITYSHWNDPSNVVTAPI